MHQQQRLIFDFRQNEQWKEVQNINRKKEDSFSLDLLDLNSATQIKSPTAHQELSQLNDTKDKVKILRNDGSSSRNYDDSNASKGKLNQQGTGKSANLDDLSISRDQSKNGYLLSASKLISLGGQQKSQYNKKQSFLLVNTNENNNTTSKVQSAGIKSAQNINLANLNLNVIMNLKKRLGYFIAHHTLFGRNFLISKNPKVRKMINDKSDGELQDGSTFSIKSLMHYLQYNGFHTIKKLKWITQISIPMITQQNTWLFIWNLYISIYNQIFMLILSFIIIFSATKDSPEIENYIFRITFYNWALEIFIKLNTSTFYKTTLFDTRIQFIYDAIPVILLQFPSDNSIIQQTIFRVPMFIKIFNLLRDQKEIEKQLMMILDNFFFIQLFNLVVNLFLVGHIIACLWYIVSIIDQTYLDKEKSWINESIGNDGVWWKIYLNAFYWSFTLMATGSNTAFTISEMFFTSVVMLFTTIIFGYMVNMIGIILSEINKLDENKLRDINIINKYMKRKHISKQNILINNKISLDLQI